LPASRSAGFEIDSWCLRKSLRRESVYNHSYRQAIKWNYRVRNLAVDTKGFMHWRFGTGTCAIDPRLETKEKKKIYSVEF
jgi:hypothetical protein